MSGYVYGSDSVVTWAPDGDGEATPIVAGPDSQNRFFSGPPELHEVPHTLCPALPGTVAEFDEKDGTVLRTTVHAWGLLPGGRAVAMILLDGMLEPAPYGPMGEKGPDRITVTGEVAP